MTGFPSSTSSAGHRRSSRSGLTLLELLIVLVILTALRTLIVPTMRRMGQRSQELATQENLRRLREMIVNQYQVAAGWTAQCRRSDIQSTSFGATV